MVYFGDWARICKTFSIRGIKLFVGHVKYSIGLSCISVLKQGLQSVQLMCTILEFILCDAWNFVDHCGHLAAFFLRASVAT